jgi:membrane protease YdiL (CAAX protease family)
VLGLWAGARVWAPLLAIAVVAGYVSGVLVGPAAVWIALLAAACVAYGRFRSIARWLAAFMVIAISVLLGLHALPGFHNALVAKNLVLSPGAAPFTLYLNFDKTTAGILIVGICHRHLLRYGREWGAAFRRAVPIILVNTAVLVFLSMSVGFLTWQPKWTPFFWIWAPTNLLLTCLSEEAFFRGFIQHELQGALSGMRHGGIIALVTSAALFGLAHFAGGWTYVMLAGVAGVGYGLAYQMTGGRLEASMAAHFTLNMTHFLLFTYPRMA